MEHERVFSKSIFGAQYRLEVAAVIESGRIFSLTELSRSLGTPPSISSVQMELKNFESAGLVVRQPSVGGMREVYYRAQTSTFWQMCRDLRTSLVRDEITSTADRHWTYSDHTSK